MRFFTFLSVYLILGPLTKTSIPTTTATSDHSFRGNETDLQALLAFKSKITHDSRGALNTWKESVDFCQWEGVICGRRHKRVTSLLLPAKGLVGTLSPFIGNLSFLGELTLSNNSITGHIPPEIGRLSRLQFFYLDYNSFEGEIPTNISRCTKLTTVLLTQNNLVGKIPSQLGFLSKLKILGLDDNNLIGDLASLANLSSLQKLGLDYQIDQGFHGRIPDFIGSFTNLTRLGLAGNSFSGSIPQSLYNLSSMQYLSLTDNRLEGSLPPDLGSYFPELTIFQINSNQLSGPIPISLSNLSNLEVINMWNNSFTGKFLFDGSNMKNLSSLDISFNKLGTGEVDDLKFLDSLVNCSSLNAIIIAKNNFGGILPHSIANFSTLLQVMDLRENQISGSIPSGLFNLVSVQRLSFFDNMLTGVIPADIGKISMLQQADFSYNQLSGIIPSSLGNLSWLSLLALQYNNLQGTVPLTLGNCKNLQYLYLYQNNLVGSLPRELFQDSVLLELWINNNRLQGSLPSEIGDLKSLTSMAFNDNNLSGEIPSSISQCLGLLSLYLQGNFFVGVIPPSLSLVTGLQVIDLSRNKLSGQVPDYFSNFSTLQVLNLSYNHLEGEVPSKGVFTNGSAISLVGNNKLCGGILQLHLPRCKTTKTKGNKSSPVLILVVSISCGLVGMVIILLLFYLFYLRRRRNASASATSSKENFPKVSYTTLLKATNGFSDENLIGAGSFGSVYKGNLIQDGVEKPVAIKVIKNERKGASKSFMAECEALRVVRHRNLVRIITACSSTDFQGNEFKALVYEFMSNGSLDSWLHSTRENNQLRSLSLQQRLFIAMDVAYALDYLHNDGDTRIIHCDLKPTNILLDEDMTAHVADFGLAKLLLENPEQLHNTSSLGVRGTVGYAAPEYGLGASVSAAGDVYSYGVILLEMVTGKTPTDTMFEGELSLHKFAQSALPDYLMEIFDPRLQFNHKVEEANNNSSDSGAVCECAIECLTTMIKIGVGCSSESPQDRMDIKDVISQLLSERNRLLLCRTRHQQYDTKAGM